MQFSKPRSIDLLKNKICFQPTPTLKTERILSNTLNSVPDVFIQRTKLDNLKHTWMCDASANKKALLFNL